MISRTLLFCIAFFFVEGIVLTSIAVDIFNPARGLFKPPPAFPSESYKFNWGAPNLISELIMYLALNSWTSSLGNSFVYIYTVLRWILEEIWSITMLLFTFLNIGWAVSIAYPIIGIANLLVATVLVIEIISNIRVAGSGVGG